MGDVVTIGRPPGFDRSIRLMSNQEVAIFNHDEVQKQIAELKDNSKRKLRTTLNLLKVALGPLEAALILEEVCADVFKEAKK